MSFGSKYIELLNVLNGARWEYYDNTVKYADKLEMLITGKDAAKLLKRFVQREDETLFQQRVNFTQVVTPAISNRIKVSFNKVLRNDDIKIIIEPADKAGEIDTTFYDNKSILSYLDERLKEVIFTDPNSHLVIDFDSFDSNTEKAKPYPVIFKSKEVLSRSETKSGELDTLITERKGKTYLWSGKIENDHRDAFNQDSLNIIVATELPKSGNIQAANIESDKINEAEPVENGTNISIGGKIYRIDYINSTAETIQAKRIGYLLQSENNFKTSISPLHYAINRMMKTIKTSSELDLTIALHAFPQKVVVREACAGYNDKDGERHRCNDGFAYSKEDDTNITCPNCKGSGYEPIHVTAADVIFINKADNKEDQIDPSMMVHYVNVDTDSPRFQNEYLNQLEEQCVKDVYASNAYSIQSKSTATEVAVQYDSVYDVIEPYTKHLEGMFGFIAKSVGRFKDIPNVVALLSFPSDLKLKSLTETLSEYELSKSAPVGVRLDLARQIINKAFQNEPNQRNRELTRLDLKPFSGYTDAEISSVVALGFVSDDQKYLYSNFDKVMRQVEESDKNFYGKPRSEQFKIVEVTATQMIPKIEFSPDLGG